ncbi:probable glucan endo-1,3-beta-glucosidase BG3 isoform X2 [Raphanus sativus]|nr:probable glucan endo-1,3-beta-glucosidase BG3 isoform X2 [Raphanus sativus]
MRLYYPDHEALTALNGSNFELILDVPNSDIQRIASNQSEADTWVDNNVRNYTKGVRFRYISVGNEVNYSDTSAGFVLPAMRNMERAVSDLGIKVSTTIGTSGFNWFPPSDALFTSNFRIFIDPVLSFLVIKKSPLLVNIDTYFTYVNTRDLSLEYALLTSNKTLFSDGSYSYRDLFLTLLDTMYAALEESRAGSVKIVVAESGWPTSGGTAASEDNARTYVNNLIRIVKSGSPRRPELPIETYLLLDFDVSFQNNC